MIDITILAVNKRILNIILQIEMLKEKANSK